MVNGFRCEKQCYDDACGCQNNIASLERRLLNYRKKIKIIGIHSYNSNCSPFSSITIYCIFQIASDNMKSNVIMMMCVGVEII